MNKISSTEKLALGMCFGVALGTIFDSLAIGLALGAACGVFWGAYENKEKKEASALSVGRNHLSS